MANPLRVIVGLGNPGHQYAATRHNAGAQWLQAVVASKQGRWQLEKKFFGHYCKLTIGGQAMHCLQPTTYMNHSGRAVAALLSYFKCPISTLLVAHDELDLPVGSVRLKYAGGHGGHNGLRDIIQALGSADFHRLRLGIGHPGHASLVHDYVLGRPTAMEQAQLQQALQAVERNLEALCRGHMAEVMQTLHTQGSGYGI